MPEIPFSYNPSVLFQYRTRNAHNIPNINVKHQFFKNPSFPSRKIEWNKVDSNTWNSDTLNISKSKILKFIRAASSSSFYCHNSIGVKILTRSRPGLSLFYKQNFKYGFQDRLNAVCSCGKEVETTSHFLLYSDERSKLLRKTRNNNLENTNSQITQFFPY